MSVNPADTSEVVGVVIKSSHEDVDAAVEAAREAYMTWHLVPPPKRGEILFRAAEILARRKAGLPKEVVNLVHGRGVEDSSPPNTLASSPIS